jgi:hypothetical protein
VNHALGLRASLRRARRSRLRAGGRLLAAVDAGTARGVLVLEPVDLRAEGYALLAQQADGSYVHAASGPVRTYRGELLGAPGSSAAVSLLATG